MPALHAKYATGIPINRNAHEASKWNPLFHERSSIPVDALKKTTGAPFGSGSRFATCLAILAIFKLLSLRTSPRLMRWVKKLLILEIIIKSPKEVTYCILRLS
jgi:hypothetical protein